MISSIQFFTLTSLRINLEIATRFLLCVRDALECVPFGDICKVELDIDRILFVQNFEFTLAGNLEVTPN